MRFELSDGSSHKFWEITQRGKVLHIAWGRIGSAGQTQDKSFATPDAAKREHDKLVASKRKKGYVAKSATKTTAKPTNAAKAATPPVTTNLMRPKRSEDLMVLSGLGQIGASVKNALAHADRAHYIDDNKLPPAVKKLRIRKLDTGSPPPWIGELRHLRTLVCRGNVKTLPPSLFTLPHLRFLHLDHTNLTSIDGIQKLRSLEAVTFGDTPLVEDEGSVEALAKKLGATAADFLPGLDFKRNAPPAPRDSKKLVALMNADELPDGSDLRRVDLSGSTFEDVYVTHDLRGAKLAATTWLRCDFEWANLAGADLTGATFHDCYFASQFGDEGMLARIKGRGATFVGCGGSLELQKADLRDARLLDLDPDVALDLTKANGQGLVLQASFCSEKEHQLEAKGADLRGAHVQFDVTPDRRAELKKKKASRLAWKTDHLKGAKTDKTTRIDYAPLDAASAAAPTRRAVSTVDPKGDIAKIVGGLHASNVSLWMVVADADVAANWRGSVDENDKKDDFQRALVGKDRMIAIGSEQGVCVEIGYRSGWSHIFHASDGNYPCFRLVDASLSDDDKATRDREIALRIAQWPVTTMPKRIGKIPCPSGVLALMLPYRDGAFTPKERAKAAGGEVVVDRDGDRVLLPMPDGPGLYEVARYPFRPEKGRGDYEDELGDYGSVIELGYIDRLPKRYTR